MALYIAVGIGLLGLLVLIHELGHFVFCKLFGVKVIRFSIGFGPALLKKKIGETEYAISLLPFGGYVKPLRAEEVDAVFEEVKKAEEFKNFSDTLLRKIVYEKFGVTEEEIETRSLDRKPYFQKLLIVLAGPFANLVSALFFVWAMLVAGIEVIPPKVGKVLEDTPAWHVGLKEGDVILEVNGREVKRWGEVKSAVALGTSEKIKLKVKRGDEVLTFEVEPMVKDGTRIIGIVPVTETVVLKYSPVEALSLSFSEFANMVHLVFLAFHYLFTSKEGVKSLGGPVAIMKIGAEAAEKGLGELFFVAFFISINLAILNLLPIPLLDGGHVLFFTIEAIIRRRVSMRVKEAVTTLGLILLIFILIIAIHNDIRMIFGKR